MSAYLLTFYLNENIEMQVLEFLKNSGISAWHTAELNNQGKDDEFQLQFAAKRNWIILTHNRRHFRQLHNIWISAGRQHAGILLTGYKDPKVIVTCLVGLLPKIQSLHGTPFCLTLSQIT